MKKKLQSLAAFTMVTLLSVQANAQQITNGSFEEGTYTSTYGTSDPAYWGTLNFDGIGLTPTTTLSTTDPFIDSTNAVMTTLTGHAALSIPDTVGGALLSTDALAQIPLNKPHTMRLQSMAFSYKANLVNGDTSVVLAQLTRWNSGTGQADVIAQAFMAIGTPTNTWTTVNVPFMYQSTLEPDSIAYIAQSSYGSWPFYIGTKLPEPGTTLEVDGFIFCDTFAIDFTTNINAGVVDFTSSTHATGNNGNGNLSWDFGDASGTSTDLNPTYTYNTAGTYTVNLTVTDSCGNDSTFSKDVIITTTASVEETVLEATDIYPNPSSGQVNIQFNSSLQKDVNVALLDLTGRRVTEVYTNNTGSNILTISTVHLEPGNYLVEIFTNDGYRTTKKLMVLQ